MSQQTPEKKFRTLQLVSDGENNVLEAVTLGGQTLFTVDKDGAVNFKKAVTFDEDAEFNAGVNFDEDPTFGDPGAALTAQAITTASFTHTAPAGEDYALQALVQSTGFGFVTANEGHSFLKLVKSMATRIDELEARLVEAGIIEAAA